MPRAEHDDAEAGVRLPGLYEWIRSTELAVALAPDPRLWMVGDPVERERAAPAAPTYGPPAPAGGNPQTFPARVLYCRFIKP